MTHPVSDLKSALGNWSDRAVSLGWLNTDNAPRVPESDEQSPAMLFDSAERPLVVAFFGGTGVGKSSLLNRLAGEAVANTGVERPTSREITLYLHNSVNIDRLPAEFPVEKIRQATHSNDKHRSVLWIDMPDFDSAETANRDLVDLWLPHIDLLVYVVNPERYRDDSGWRMLLQHATRHAWVFIINHWDRGAPGQKEAFRNILGEAGLAEPMLFCTDCGPDPQKPNGDEFDEFQQSIVDLSGQRVIQQLEQHGVLVRVAEANTRLQRSTQSLETIPSLSESASTWHDNWENRSAKLLASQAWKINSLALPYRAQDTGLFKKLIKTILRRESSDLPPPAIDATELADSAFMDGIGLEMDDAMQQIVTSGVPVAAAKRAMQPLQPGADMQTRLASYVRQELERSLALPGTPTQRLASKVLGIAALAAPLGILAWAVYKLLVNYQTGQQYLGFDFATHTMLLAGLAWFIPWCIRHFIRPTHEAAAKRGMKNGINKLLGEMGTETKQALGNLEQERQTLLTDAGQIFNVIPPDIKQAITTTAPSGQSAHDPVSRVLVQSG